MRRFVLFGLLAMLVPAAGANANTVEVTTTAESPGPGCTLRDAIAVVPNGGTTLNGCTSVTAGGINRINFAGSLSGQTIELSDGALSIDAPITDLEINGLGMNELTISAADDERALNLGVGIIDISGLTVRDGEAGSIGPGDVRGGCILADPDSNVDLIDVRVTNCSAITSGIVNQVADGAGVATAGDLTLVDSLVDGNTIETTNTGGDVTGSFARGAGIWGDGGSNLKLINSVVRSNAATAEDDDDGTASAAGGVFSADDVEISGSTISGNTGTATQTGPGGEARTAGGIMLADGDSSIELSTIAGNIGDADADMGVTHHGGGITTQAEDLEIRSSTIALNGPTTGTLDGVNLFVNGGAGTLVVNTILADPRGGGQNCLNPFGPLTSGGFNVDYTPALGGGTCFLPPAATDLTTNPLLATAGLANNGGGTETIALQAGSPAIDKGSNAADDDPDFDQRGLLRPVDFTGLANAPGGNGTDIGALEVQLACAGQATPATSCSSGGGGGSTTPTTPAATGKRAAALKKCKKIKVKKKRNNCKKKAQKQPV